MFDKVMLLNYVWRNSHCCFFEMKENPQIKYADEVSDY